MSIGYRNSPGRIMDNNGLWLGFFTVLGIASLWGTVTGEGEWGQVYLFIFFFTIIGFVLSTGRTHKWFEFINLNPKTENMAILFGLILGFTLTSSLMFGISIFSFVGLTLIPLSIPPLLGLGWAQIPSIILLSIGVSEFEESFRGALLRPTFFEWMSNKKGMALALMLISGFLYTIGGYFQFIGATIFIYSILALMNWVMLPKAIKNEKVRHAVSIIAVGFIFAMLHFKAYSSPDLTAAMTTNMLFSAFLFAAITDTINVYFKSSTTGKVAHTWNNAAVASVLVGVPWLFAAIPTVAHIAIIKGLSKRRSRRR